MQGSSTWKINVADTKRVDTFQRNCLQIFLKIRWPTVITNNDLYETTKLMPISTTIYMKRWKEIGHILRRDATNNSRIALTWAPDGRRKTVDQKLREDEW